MQRLAIAFLPLAGLLGLALALLDPALPAVSGGWEPAVGGWTALQHRQLMLVLLAAGLLATPWLPSIRLPAIAASVLAKASYWGLVLVGAGPAAATPLSWLEAGLMLALAAAGAVLLREARLEARWEGVLPLRQQIEVKP